MAIDDFHSDDGVAKQDAEKFEIDPFKPFEDVELETNNIITLRAIVVGCLCGMLINASNIYLGLKTGWTSSANIFGSIVGFSILKKLSFHKSFGLHENNIVQTVATASGGMSNVFVSAIPALYQLNLLKTPPADFMRIVTVTAVGGYFGLLSVVPLRRFFIEHVARDLNLIFPSSCATAITIRSMHLAASGAKLARQRTKATLFAFLAAMLMRIASTFAVGILWDWHVLTWLREANIFTGFAIAAESWGWFIEWSPAMIGSGMLVGMNVAASFFAGSVIAWAIIGPYLVSRNVAFGQSVTEDPFWAGLTSYTSMDGRFASPDHPSPRYWLLWPGVACMLAVAFTELACQGKAFYVSARSFSESMITMYKRRANRKYHYTILTQPDQETQPKNSMESIPTWMWAPGLLVVIIAACLVTKLQFNMSILETLLALTLAFILSLVAIQATGATDTTPLTAVSKVSQILLSATTKGTMPSLAAAQRLNLLGGALTNIGASQACDLMGDFRVGFLLQTPPHLQYIAQLIGTLVAAFTAPAVFVLFTSAYPCILSIADNAAVAANNGTNPDTRTCEFTGPSIAAWRAVAIAATTPSSTSPIPSTSIRFSIVFAALASAMVLVRNFLWVGKLHSIRAWQPNMMILAMAFTLPSPQYGLAMLIGAAGAAVWRAKGGEGFERLGFSVAAGLVAGEGIGGTINGILSISGLKHNMWSTNIGCPAGQC